MTRIAHHTPNKMIGCYPPCSLPEGPPPQPSGINPFGDSFTRAPAPFLCVLSTYCAVGPLRPADPASSLIGSVCVCVCVGRIARWLLPGWCVCVCVCGCEQLRSGWPVVAPLVCSSDTIISGLATISHAYHSLGEAAEDLRSLRGWWQARSLSGNRRRPTESMSTLHSTFW